MNSKIAFSIKKNQLNESLKRSVNAVLSNTVIKLLRVYYFNLAISNKLYLMEYFFSVEMHVTDVDREYLDVDLRNKLEENTKKRKMTTTDELAATKEALKKVTDEMKLIREEMNEMRKDQGATGAGAPENFALGFSVNDFMTMSPTKSLQWVSSTLVPRLKQEMAKHGDKFKGVAIISGAKPPNMWTCAGYNRGNCNAKWHLYERPAKNNPSHKFKDLRLHGCTLCYEAFGFLVNHPLMGCPWIKDVTWESLDEGQGQEDGQEVNLIHDN